jgi:hypothetical protein
MPTILRPAFRRGLIFLFCISSFACGSVSSQNLSGLNSNTSQLGASRVYLFATDQASSGQVYTASTDGSTTVLINSGLNLLGSSAIIRSTNNLLYILHLGFSAVSSDNLQIVDPSDNYATLAQFSTGNGTNPHDVVITGSRAFIALYNPSADPANVDGDGNPADVIEMNTNTGAIVHRYSFADFLNPDGDLNANAEQMLLVGGKVYVLLQDLVSNTYAANTTGKLGVINIATNTI